MTVGTGIFLSAVLLSLVLLFNGTKDRWKWKRIALFVFGVPIALAGAAAAWFGTENWLEGRPKPQTSFLDIPLTATKADVKFIKGEPVKTEGENTWVYAGEARYGAQKAPLILVNYVGDRVSFILYSDEGLENISPYMLGFAVGSTYEDVVSELGPPSNTASSADELSRILSYEKLNAFFSFTKGKVSALGIYQPKDGSMGFGKADQQIEEFLDEPH